MAAPTSEGVGVFSQAPVPRRDSRVAFGSIYGRDIVSHGSMRPRVVVNEGDQTNWYNAGLTPPGKGAYVSDRVAGNINGKALFGIARYDSVRDRYSNMVQIGTFGGTVYRNDTFDVSIDYNVETTDEGIPLGLSTAAYPLDAKVRTGLKQKGVRVQNNAGQAGYTTTTSLGFISLRLRSFNGTALTGTIYVVVDGVESDTISASVLSDYYATNPDEYKEVEFSLKNVLSYTSEKTVDIELYWSAAATQTDNLILWKGNFETASSPTVDATTWGSYSNLTDILEEVIVTNIETSEGTALANWNATVGRHWTVSTTNWFTTDATNSSVPFWNPSWYLGCSIQTRTYTEGGGGTIVGFGGPTYDSSSTATSTPPGAGQVEYIVCTGPRLYWIKSGLNISSDDTIRGNQGYSSATSLTIPWNDPPADTSSWEGKTVGIFKPGRTTPLISGNYVSSDANSIVINDWRWKMSGSVARSGVTGITGTIFPDATYQIRSGTALGYFSVDGLIDGTWTASGAGAAYAIDASRSIVGSTTYESVSEFDFTGTSYGGVVVSAIDQCRGDEATDEYDSFAMLAYLYSTGEWYRVANISKETTAYTINSVDVNSTPVFPPLQNFVPPAASVIKKFVQGTQERLVLTGQDGFDCFVDMPRLENLSPSARLSSAGIITFSDPVYSYRDGTYLVTAYDSQGNELVRGFIHNSSSSGPPYYTGTGLASASLTQYQIQICQDFERSEAFTFDQDASGDWENQRWEIRRQLVATATRNSNVINVSYDTAGSTSPEVLGQHIVHCPVQVGGASGTGFCDKIATKAGTYFNSLDNDKTLGNRIILREAWEYAPAIGLLIIHPRKRSIAICKGSIAEFDSMSLQGMYDVKSSLALKTLEVTGSTITAISEANEVFVLEATSNITDPSDFTTAIIFNVRQFFDDRKYVFPFSCVSTKTWNYPTSRIGWIGSEGPRSFDFVKVDMLLADSQRTAWNNLNTESLKLATAAVDSMHDFSPVIRIAGMRATAAGAKDRQFAYSHDRNVWLNYSGQASIDDMITVALDNGSQRVLFGSSGRLYLYGQPNRTGQNTANRDIYLFPYIGGTQYGTVTGITHLVNNALIDSTASFPGFGDGYCFKGSGVRVVKMDDLGAEEWATITSRYSSTTLYVTPDSTWTFDAARSYRYIIGPCAFRIDLPILIPGEGMGYVEIDRFRLDFRDYSSYNWKTTTTISASYDTSNLEDGATVATIDLNATDMVPLWHEHTVATAMDYALRMRVTGIHPPNGKLLIRGIDVSVRYHD